AEANQTALRSAAHSAAVVAGERRGYADGRVYAARHELTALERVRRITIQAVQPQGDLVIAGLALVDSRNGSSYSPSLDSRLRRGLVSDLKVYQNLVVQPRALLLGEQPD